MLAQMRKPLMMMRNLTKMVLKKRLSARLRRSSWNLEAVKAMALKVEMRVKQTLRLHSIQKIKVVRRIIKMTKKPKVSWV
jgi:hypothetical protein